MPPEVGGGDARGPEQALVEWERPIPRRAFSRAILEVKERSSTQFMDVVADPKSVKVNVTTGTGMEIEWKDGHKSAYSFPFLRDACPCALCNEERETRRPAAGRSAEANRGSSAHVQGSGAAHRGQAGRQVRHQLPLERRTRARHLFLDVPTRPLPLRGVQGTARDGSFKRQQQAELICALTSVVNIRFRVS